MSGQSLDVHFADILEAPDAIGKLRRFVVDLAVRGKLVEQDTNDEPAHRLLKLIAAEKKRLIDAGELKHQEESIDVDCGAVPIKPPQGWVLTRLRAITRRIHYGYTASADLSTKHVRLLRITDIQNNA